MAKNSSSRRLVRQAGQIDKSEFAWSPHFANRPDETSTHPLPFFEIIEDIHDWLRQDEVTRYATEPLGSDYFQKAWKNEEQFSKTRSHFEVLSQFGFYDEVKFALDDGPSDYAKKTVAETEHYLGCFRHALQHQLDCAAAARAYAQTVGKEHHNELVPFVPLSPEKLAEALDLHLIDVGKHDPLLKHHIHAALDSAVHVEGETPNDVLDATFDATKFDRYFAKLEKHLRTNITTVGDMITVLSRFRERIDEASQSPQQRQR